MCRWYRCKTDTIQGRTCTHAQRTGKFAAKDCCVKPPLQFSFPGVSIKIYSKLAGFPVPAAAFLWRLGARGAGGCRRPLTCTCIPPLRPKLLLWAMQRVETLQEETPVSRQPVPSTGQLALTSLWYSGQNKGKGGKKK